MERYSSGGLDPAGCKVGLIGQGVELPPTGSTWLEVDRGDLGLTFC
jgi:hypothetical protein